MVFKINVSHNGRTYKLEKDNENLMGISIGDKINGSEIDESLKNYEIEITGTSDKAGFPGMTEIEGPRLKKVLLTYGKGMHKKPKGLKKVNKKPTGLRLRKTVRGKEISLETVQINAKVIKEGDKKFDELVGKKEVAPAQ
jgi:small subunit ribosomal protein S6e